MVVRSASMPRRYASHYIHRPSVGDLARCNDVAKATIAILSRRREAGELDGYFLRVIADAENALEPRTFVDDTPVTAGRFPFIWCCVQPLQTGGAEPEEVMRAIDPDYVRLPD